jgi:hypothetical protein
MTTQTFNARSAFWEVVRQQGPALACAVTVGAVVIVLFHAPVAATLGGCGLALVFLFARTWRKLRSS